MPHCKFCGKYCAPLGLARHRASHFDAKSKNYIPKLVVAGKIKDPLAGIKVSS